MHTWFSVRACKLCTNAKATKFPHDKRILEISNQIWEDIPKHLELYEVKSFLVGNWSVAVIVIVIEMTLILTVDTVYDIYKKTFSVFLCWLS